MTRECLVAFEVCGCLAAVAILTGNESDAYQSAARWTKRGERVERMASATFRDVPLHCADHPDGPPWWKSNGGDGKRPAKYAPRIGAGL